MTRDRNFNSLVTRAASLRTRLAPPLRYFHIYTRIAARRLQRAAHAPLSWRRRHWAAAGVFCAAVVLVGAVVPSGGANATRQSGAAIVRLELPVPKLDSDAVATGPGQDEAYAEDASWTVLSVRPGQTVAEIFASNGVSPATLQKLLDDSANAKALRNIHPGDEFAFHRGADGGVDGVRFDRDDRTRIVVAIDADGVHQRVVDRLVERRTHVAHGIVESSLFDAGNQAGMDDAMVIKLANAFGYDIDFAQDLREGDSFTVIYDDVYREGEKLRDGDIIAATFINRGKRFTAFRYTDAHGKTMYYSEDGRPLRKSFLRTPVAFTRISSRFTAHRMHPILGIMRAHRGVDYVAAAGTPIHAAGDGRVIFRGWQHGYGNVVILKHGRHFSTLYGHMSRFASIHVGQRVHQGQTIGYVGMTGLATAPHLHYEFRVDGVHRNPLTVTLPKPEPLPQVELARFRAQTQPELAKLKALEATQLALAR